MAACQDPDGTRVETYLGHRAITARPLPPSIRYLNNAYGHYGALVALATDTEGQVHGLQLVYLTEDGRKAPLKIQKRTNKAHDGWSDISAVRLPGTTPVVLCEGVETALSVWQATGQETWACLGISNIARAGAGRRCGYRCAGWRSPGKQGGQSAAPGRHHPAQARLPGGRR